MDAGKVGLPKFGISHRNEIPGQLGMCYPVVDAVAGGQIDRR
jgi:hypothetical protein